MGERPWTEREIEEEGEEEKEKGSEVTADETGVFGKRMDKVVNMSGILFGRNRCEAKRGVCKDVENAQIMQQYGMRVMREEEGTILNTRIEDQTKGGK